MSSVYDLHLRTAALRTPDGQTRAAGEAARPGETSGERRIRLLRTVLGERRGGGPPPEG